MTLTPPARSSHRIWPSSFLRSPFDVEMGVKREDDDSKKQPHSSRIQYFRSLVWLRSFIILAVLYLIALTLVIALFKRLPKLEELRAHTEATGGDAAAAASLQLAVPHSFDELRAVRATLEAYREAYSSQVATLLVVTYLFLQTFMIPGPLGINVLAGSLYPFGTAMAFAALVSTLGASLNYWLVRCLLKDVLVALFPSRIGAFQAELARHKTHLFNFMLFVRVTPVLPHWFVNVASPIVGVPFHIFLTATAIGHQPMNFITVQAGAALATIHGLSDLYSPRNVMFLMGVGILALMPVLWKRRRQRRAASTSTSSQKMSRKPSIRMLPVIDKSSLP